MRFSPQVFSIVFFIMAVTVVPLRGAPDLVITDIVMPDMEGMELLRTLSRQGITIPVIVMSGNSLGTKFLDAAHLFGAQASLRKPFSKQELLDAVTRVLGNQHPLEQTDAVEGV